MSLLASVREVVTREPKLRDVLEQTGALIAGALGADGCLIPVVESGQLVVGPLRMTVGFGVMGRVAADGIPVTLVDDNPRNPLHRDLLGLAAGDLVSRLVVPARVPSGDCTAVVAVHQRRRRSFTPAEVSLCQRAADLLALRIALDSAASDAASCRADWDGLVAATVAAQEAERRRVAADLHDGVSQAIASLTFHLSAASSAIASGDLTFAGEQVAAARTLAELAVGETRSAITGLHSPVIDDLGLAAALTSLARSVPSLSITVEADDVDLPEPVTVSLFRVAQEAVQNVVKHADASGAEISLVWQGNSVVLTVSDDGRGFAATTEMPRAGTSTGRYGLAGMAERVHLIGGVLRVRSAPGEGTTIEVTVPARLS